MALLFRLKDLQISDHGGEGKKRPGKVATSSTGSTRSPDASSPGHCAGVLLLESSYGLNDNGSFHHSASSLKGHSTTQNHIRLEK